LTWGPQVEYLEGLKEDGLDPQALKNKPVVTGAQHFYRDVYADLSDSRGYTQTGSPLPIPLSEVLSYFEMFGIRSLDHRERILYMVRAMDRTFVKVVSDQIRDKMEQESATRSKTAVAR
jgi:hypothetical protein